MPALIHALVFWLGIASLAIALPTSAKERAKLAIIIDDLGYNLTLGQRTTDLPGAFTIAVLPFTPHGRELAERAHKRGKEVMLHAPMSNHHRYPLGRGGLVSGMKKAEFLAVLRQNLANIPYVKGVNNHMGSQLTEQTEPMRWLMHELQSRRLYFVDSRTSAQTQALIEAERIRLPSRKRDVFLDDKRDSQHIHQQLLLAMEKARKQGAAIAIGHPYPETLALLNRLEPLLDRYAIELVPVSTLVPRFAPPAQSIGYCLAPPPGFWPQTWAPIDIFDEDLFTLPSGLR
ncbi:MAG: hypothetical protein B0W54_17025 [Cellvibrio sp. 79]|nr:MAG: hypothetical protein B0W54_17025 [Cellvibrio sp. 79]